ncbi:MAG: hypothetical protein WCF77_02895 [Minisyncoccia bacterium]
MLKNEADFVLTDVGALVAGIDRLHVLFCTYNIGTPLAQIGSEAMDEEARTAQSELEAKLKIESQANASLLAVVYAGLSAFDEALEFARKVKQDRPDAKVVIVTCDCDLRRKASILEPMLQSEELEAVVVTHWCGGRSTMRDILEKIVEVWPVSVSVLA